MAASEKIVHLAKVYKDSYTFCRIPCQLCYATYIANTILVRNANTTPSLVSTKHVAICLKGFEETKLAHPGTERKQATIRRLICVFSEHGDVEGLIVAAYILGTVHLSLDEDKLSAHCPMRQSFRRLLVFIA